MARFFCIPGIFFLLCAFVLLVLTSISLPFLSALDITRVHYLGPTDPTVQGSPSISELRFGIWSYCYYATSSGDRTCSSATSGYGTAVSGGGNSVEISSGFTDGLAIHPVAAVVTFLALLLSFSQHLTVTLLASLVSFLAALLTLIAFALDIALLADVKNKMGDLTDASSSVQSKTVTGPGFWLTFASLILLLLAGCTVCFGRRRDQRRMAGATAYPATPRRGLFSRFRKY